MPALASRDERSATLDGLLEPDPVDVVAENFRVRDSLGHLVRALRSDDGRNRSDENPEVACERPVRDIEVVELHHLVEGNVRATEYLPHPCHPRAERQSPT